MQYERDKCSNISYAYLILYVADTQGECFRGVYAGTETMTIDLRKALPSVILRPCAQHGWIVKKLSRDGDLSRNVSCVLRMQVDLVDRMLGNGELVQQKTSFLQSKKIADIEFYLGANRLHHLEIRNTNRKRMSHHYFRILHSNIISKNRQQEM